jgi:hypothetical protein
VSEFKVGLREEIGGEHGDDARRRFIEALGNPASTEPDETGTFEVTLEADTVDDALLAAWNAVAAAGAEDHLLFLEHPNLPEHWRRVPR